MTPNRLAGMAGLLTLVLIATPGRLARAQATPAAFNDTLFTEAAAGAGMAEVVLAEMALDHGVDRETSAFAQHMIVDHGRANQELTAMAAAKHIAIPAGLSVADKATAEILGGLRGEEFDREFAKQQMAAHLNTVALFHAEATRGQDPELKAFAAKTLPHLRQHLAAAYKLAKLEMERSAEGHK